MNRIVRTFWIIVSAIYLTACATAPASQADRPVMASDCRDVQVGPSHSSGEPMPCAPPQDSASVARAVVAVLAVAAVIALVVAIRHVPFSPGLQGGAP